MRKKDENLKENLLGCAREIANTQGTSAISIRAIAKKADIAVGTVYNYFTSKDEILLILTEEYWQKALMEMQKEITSPYFYNNLSQVYDFLMKHMSTSASMLMTSLSNVEQKGQQKMHSMVCELKKIIFSLLDQDKNINPKIWNENFTKESYADFINNNLLISLRTRQKNIDFLIEIVKLTLY